MFDFSKLTDMSKLASEAKEIQQKQEHLQNQQLEMLKKISGQLDEALSILREKS